MLYDINQITIEEVIIYLRKSRSDDPSMSVEDVLAKHEEQLQEHAEETFGQKIPEHNIYREVVSGETISDRPVMQQLMKLLETGKKKVCLVIEPQRLSRGDLEDCGKVINTFRYTNTLVMTPPKTYNLSDEYDRKFFEMELMRGNDYLEYTKKILNRGRLASAKKGNFIGNFAPYGYKKVKIGTGKDSCFTLEIIPEQADAVRLMYKLYIEGNGFTNIAKKLDSLGIKPMKADAWSPAAISDMIENPVYAGKIRWNYRKTIKRIEDGQIVKSRPNNNDPSDYILVEGKHEAIIDQATFDAAAERRGKTPKVKKGKELQNPFAGLLFCGTCGTAMSFKKYRHKNAHGGYMAESMLCNRQSWCHTKSVKYDAFFERVVESLERTIADFELKLQNDDGDAAKLHVNIIHNLEMDLKKLKEKDLRQKDAFDDGIYSKEEYLSRNAKVQEEISKTTEALCNARHSVPPAIDYQEKIVRFKDCLNALNDPDVPAKEKNMLLKACIEKIVYHNNMASKPGKGRWIENKFDLEIFLRL